MKAVVIEDGKAIKVDVTKEDKQGIYYTSGYGSKPQFAMWASVLCMSEKSYIVDDCYKNAPSIYK